MNAKGSDHQHRHPLAAAAPPGSGPLPPAAPGGSAPSHPGAPAHHASPRSADSSRQRRVPRIEPRLPEGGLSPRAGRRAGSSPSRAAPPPRCRSRSPAPGSLRRPPRPPGPCPAAGTRAASEGRRPPPLPPQPRGGAGPEPARPAAPASGAPRGGGGTGTCPGQQVRAAPAGGGIGPTGPVLGRAVPQGRGRRGAPSPPGTARPSPLLAHQRAPPAAGRPPARVPATRQESARTERCPVSACRPQEGRTGNPSREQEVRTALHHSDSPSCPPIAALYHGTGPGNSRLRSLLLSEQRRSPVSRAGGAGTAGGAGGVA
ncbi:uncharacterized protein LOC141728651 [Zonotrichia albicollis]|uniref:uncharacterized protein LOC141728651 n=1 Tax=Zonotrichia albicollis TaxID=44394 RepID=UPI003D80B469